MFNRRGRKERASRGLSGPGTPRGVEPSSNVSARVFAAVLDLLVGVARVAPGHHGDLRPRLLKALALPPQGGAPAREPGTEPESPAARPAGRGPSSSPRQVLVLVVVDLVVLDFVVLDPGVARRVLPRGGDRGHAAPSARGPQMPEHGRRDGACNV